MEVIKDTEWTQFDDLLGEWNWKMNVDNRVCSFEMLTPNIYL